MVFKCSSILLQAIGAQEPFDIAHGHRSDLRSSNQIFDGEDPTFEKFTTFLNFGVGGRVVEGLVDEAGTGGGSALVGFTSTIRCLLCTLTVRIMPCSSVENASTGQFLCGCVQDETKNSVAKTVPLLSLKLCHHHTGCHTPPPLGLPLESMQLRSVHPKDYTWTLPGSRVRRAEPTSG